jgi:signal transduction histidine kinase
VLREHDCITLIRHALARVEPAATAREVEIVSALPDGSITCRTDGQRVEQILLNLLGNAIRHTPEGSRVTVSMGQVDRTARIEIVDEGPGITEDQVERVFDVYETKAGEERLGTGLGLPLSRRLAQLLGGNLYATVTSGTGARFTLELPTQDEERSGQ